ncbi:hypothetical protein R5R35_009738 [Gryllus longicercus]|uniref:Cyclin-H n=1 Tax=Gryllus longicercus TaxID=2509291 RepID=A0AAN9ZFJ2_9ORTH
MYPGSTQQKFWTFKDENDLVQLRQEANEHFIEKHKAGMSPEQSAKFFLTPAEERLLLRQYELHLRDFCRRFHPAQPRTVYATACHYFKRFYLKCSLMDFHPKEILATCAYLACKVEEFNISISQFVANIRGDRDKASGIILANELLLMQKLNYHLTIHNPHRAVEGLLIDIKTRSQLKDPERLRPHIDEFIDRLFLTDACLLYAPSQLALAAVLHAVSKLQENLDTYVTDVLIGQSGADKLSNIIEAVRKIRTMGKSLEPLPRDTLRLLEKKLEKCRNQENNPDSAIYKQRMLEEAIDEDDEPNYPVTSESGADENLLTGIVKLRSPDT